MARQSFALSVTSTSRWLDGRGSRSSKRTRQRPGRSKRLAEKEWWGLVS